MNEQRAMRVPPQSLDAERSILGGILLDNAALGDVVEALRGPGDFYAEKHRKVYEAMLSLSARGEPIDRVTVKGELVRLDVFAIAGGEDYIDLLDKLVPSASNLRYYAEIVREKAIVRDLILAGHTIAAQGYEQHGELADFIEECQQRVLSVVLQQDRGGLEQIREGIKVAFKQVEKLYERNEDVTGVASGFIDLDRMTAGYQPADLVIVAGRPSMGKTTFAMNCAENAALGIPQPDGERKRVSVAVFSLEQPRTQLIFRMLSSVGRVDLQRLRTGRLVDSDWVKLGHAAGELAGSPIFIDDSASVSLAEVRARTTRLAAKLAGTEAPLGLVVIDYLQLMRHRDMSSREEAVSDTSRGLKALAKDLNVPLIALSQLSRALEKRPDKRPILSDLRESGSLEQDGDVVIFLYREEVYDKNNDAVKGVAEVIVGKQRNGPIGIATLAFLHEFTRFENLAREYGEPQPQLFGGARGNPGYTKAPEEK